MDKQFLSKLIDGIIEFFIYVAVIGITFSNAATEVGTYVSIFFFFIKKIIFKDFTFPRNKINKLIILFLIVNIISTLHNFYLYQGLYLQNSLKGIFRIIKYFLFLGVVTYVSSKQKSFHRIIFVFGLASVVICLDALFQNITGADLFRHNTLTPHDDLRRLSAGFAHPNDFGSYLITAIPIYIGLIYYFKKIWQKLFISAPLILLLFCLYRTASRGAWLGFIIAMLIFILFKRDKILIIITILFLISAPFFLPKTALERLKQGFNISDGTTWERKQIWTGAINIFKVHPLIGFGPNTFSDNFPKYKPKYYPDLRYAHNSYLQMLAEIGIIGLAIFLFILFTVIKTGFKYFRQLRNSKPLEAGIVLGITSGLIAFLIHSGLDTNLYSLVLATLFWTMTGLIFAFKDAYIKEKI
ncbi:MAG: O-antigen ligase family protein [Patescibacteria group bacterium]